MAALFATLGSVGDRCEQRLVAGVGLAEPAAALGLHRERAGGERVLRLGRAQPGEIDRLRGPLRRGERRVQHGIGRDRRAASSRPAEPPERRPRHGGGRRQREHDALPAPAVDDADREQRQREPEQPLAEQGQDQQQAAQEGDAREGGHLSGDRIAEIVRRVGRREQAGRRDAEQAAHRQPDRGDHQPGPGEPERRLEVAGNPGERRPMATRSASTGDSPCSQSACE